MLHRVCPRLCRAVSNNLNQTRTTIIVKRVHKPPLMGEILLLLSTFDTHSYELKSLIKSDRG